ncbi:hypothetical protein BT96DRAFT_939144 [Gymnopus androsaceus JB14]|uniref:Uncharacterized protein n=1 Tax=Gymnopus androsaceus JB14 TaxID=1447944 RepID=A0A6A4HS16_9AGAR|nr:hypothetical protein BT96DRAFT_939144 [Gymnopus androsaceus JB14]
MVKKEESKISDRLDPAPSQKQKAIDCVKKHQQKLKTYKWANIPFSDKETEQIHAQFLRATLSANLPFFWVKDPKIIKKSMRECNAVKDISRISLMGVSVSSVFKNEDPIIFWKSMKTNGAIEELANFALLILGNVMNTAGNEWQFSKVKICKDRLHNWLQLKKLKQSIKNVQIIENVQEHHYSNGLKDEQQACKNHSDEHEADGSSALVTNCQKWHTEFEQWKKDTERHDKMFGEDLNADLPPLPETQRASHQWLLHSLALLFGGKPSEPVVGSTPGAMDQPQCPHH